MGLSLHPLASIAVGTASWTDKSLLASKRFYPPGVNTAESRLRYYATQFPLVEVDAGFYAMPTPARSMLWCERTPPSFVFNVKPFRLFTGHQTPVTSLDADLRRALPRGLPATVFIDQVPGDIVDELWRRFLVSLDPLRMADKLGLVHFQFPPWVRNDARGRARIADCVSHMDDMTAGVELRHHSWFASPAVTDRTLAFQRELGVVHTIVDSPKGFDNTVPAIWTTTHPELALVRLHGRNHAAWNATGPASSSRFNYDYAPHELAELAEHIRRLAQKIERTHVVFNTNYQDQGMRNAKGLMSALDASRPLLT